MDKKAATYKQIFSELKSIAARKGTTFAPSLIMTDFESGVITAMKAEVSRFCLDKRIYFFTCVFVPISVPIVQAYFMLFSLLPSHLPADPNAWFTTAIFVR